MWKLSGQLKDLPLELVQAVVEGACVLIVAETIKKSTEWFEGLADGVNKFCDPETSTNIQMIWKEAGAITRYSITGLPAPRTRFDIVLVDRSLDPFDISKCQSYVKLAKDGGAFLTVPM